MSAAAKADTDLEAFRAQARAWLEANFPPALKGRGGMMMGEDGPASGGDFAKWKTAMGDKGWGTPTYPRQYGGGGLSQAQVRVLQQEMNRLGVNPIGGMGVMINGPTLLEYAARSRSRNTSRHRQGTTWWCQGAEPGRLRPRVRCARNASTRAITSWSTARRSGPRARSSPTCASRWSAPTTPGSTRASPSCSST